MLTLDNLYSLKTMLSTIGALDSVALDFITNAEHCFKNGQRERAVSSLKALSRYLRDKGLNNEADNVLYYC